MGFKEKRREQATLSHQYGICDQVSEEISGLKDWRRVLEKELHDLKKKEKQSKRYKKKVVKLRSNSESSSSSSITGSMKQVDSNDSEDLQFLPPSSSSETPTSRSLVFSQAATDSAQVGMPSLFDTLKSISDTAASPTSPSVSTYTISPSPQPRASSETPSLADLISSAIDSDVYLLSTSDSPSPQASQTSGSQTFAELLNSALAASSKTLSICEEPEDSSVQQRAWNTFNEASVLRTGVALSRCTKKAITVYSTKSCIRKCKFINSIRIHFRTVCTCT